MLAELAISDLGVIDDLRLLLGGGMTALTGETGAGKTMLVEALQLVLGGRAASGLVRAGAAEAMVEARFEVDRWPAAAPGGPDETGSPGKTGSPDKTGAIPVEPYELIVARSVPASGRSRAWLNGRMVPVAVLAELAGELVDIHGQHDHQSLLAPAAQRRALDAYAGT